MKLVWFAACLALTASVALGAEPGQARNRRFRIDDFAASATSPKERRHLAQASAAVDEFVEIRDPDSRDGVDPAQARALYEYLFPNKDEAEDWNEAIVPRLRKSVQGDASLAGSRFHVVVCTRRGAVVGYSQFSTMALADGSAVVYWQYGGVADEPFMRKSYGRSGSFREKGINSAFFVLRHAIAAEDAREMGLSKGVVGTMLEAEFIGQADNEEDIRFTAKRLHVHRQTGAKAMLLETAPDKWLTAHLQPRLSETSNPILLHMLFRPLRYDPQDLTRITEMDRNVAEALVMAYLDNFLREGFRKEDVEAARTELRARFAKAKRVLLVPPERLPNIVQLARHDPLLRAQVLRDYGPLEKHEALVKSALRR